MGMSHNMDYIISKMWAISMSQYTLLNTTTEKQILNHWLRREY